MVLSIAATLVTSTLGLAACTSPSPLFDTCADWRGCSRGMCYGDLGFVWSGGRCVRVLGCQLSGPEPDRTYAECVAHHASCANAIAATNPSCPGDGGACTSAGTMCTVVDGDAGTGCVPGLNAPFCE
jgi:hypothetical protein